ncbi:hypothetical protein ABZ027_08390 [Streptomyces sp. NPDC006332]|uniref:hypothetical protein n=1 Tax=Streptomyces sp. NPDC006332 TaxID=3155456 RepID=UPI0033B57FDD
MAQTLTTGTGTTPQPEVRQRTEQLQADDTRADGHVDRINLLAALPAAVDEAVRKALPGKNAPALAAQIAAGMIARLTAPAPQLSTEQTTLVLDEGIGAWTTTPVETTLRDIDDQHTASENAEVPFLAAQMVVSDYRPQAYGRRTEVWLSYGTTVGSLTPAKARNALEAMRSFVDQLEAVVDLAEETAASDFEGDPEVARLDREAEARRIAAVTEGRK